MPQPIQEGKERGRFGHYRPVWITLVFLVASLFLTTRYYKGIESPELFPSNILVVTLVNVNIILVILLILLLSRNLIKVYFERRLRLLGSGFRAKLIAVFVGLSLIPSVLLFAVASGLLTSSIENWFSIQVDKSLEASLKIAQDAHEQAKATSIHYAREIGRQINEGPYLVSADPSLMEKFLYGKIRELRVSAIELYRSPTDQALRVSDPEFSDDSIVNPSIDLLRSSLNGQGVVEEIPISHQGQRGKLMRAIAPLKSPRFPEGVVVVDQYIPETLLRQMDQVTMAFEEYKQLQTFKNPIKGSYILSFLIITLLIIFAATWFGFYIAKGITIPIQKLAEGTHAVAQGRLDFKIDVKARDEIGVLVKSFNKMTEDLKSSKTKLEEANLSLQKSNAELDRRRAYIETVLDNITTGVLSIDPGGTITTFNRAAERILGTRSEDLKGKHFTVAFKAHDLTPLIDLVNKLEVQQKSSLDEELALDLNGTSLTLHLNLSRLREDDGRPMGSVMVFDDLSELIKAQKVAAWQEVAKRIAHEIKNPLTPIQLAAQRIRKKYYEDSGDFHNIFDESTKIIVNEVNSLKSLVDEFSNFARMPSPRPELSNLHQILEEVILLYQGTHKDVQIVLDRDQRLPMLMLDRDQIKRAFINLFENAVEAMGSRGRLWITTRYDDREQRFCIEISDEGTGIQPEDMDKLFLPYFSRKKSGTGLGLAIVNRIISDHNGIIRVFPNKPVGTKFIIELPVPSPTAQK